MSTGTASENIKTQRHTFPTKKVLNPIHRRMKNKIKTQLCTYLSCHAKLQGQPYILLAFFHQSLFSQHSPSSFRIVLILCSSKHQQTKTFVCSLHMQNARKACFLLHCAMCCAKEQNKKRMCVHTRKKGLARIWKAALNGGKSMLLF
jgi:hypothetical protein